jgi:hypothetical protein
VNNYQEYADMDVVEVINIRDKNRDAVPVHKAGLFFYGDEGNPFLAPRGVHAAGGKLIVADTAQNRVFIWNEMPGVAYQKPDLVLGQSLLTDTQRNAGGIADASSLQYPSGVWSDGKKLIVADAWNHRVLIWNQFPTENGQPADVVVGQPDMQNNLPNVNGVGAGASAKTLHWPYGVWSDGTHLWIADTGNRRVGHHNYCPITHTTGQNYPAGLSASSTHQLLFGNSSGYNNNTSVRKGKQYWLGQALQPPSITVVQRQNYPGLQVSPRQLLFGVLFLSAFVRLLLTQQALAIQCLQLWSGFS